MYQGLLDCGLQEMLDKGLTVVFGESGSHILNPNALTFMQDLFDFCKEKNIGFIQECFRAWDPNTGNYGTGILNTDWSTLNTLGQVWARNMVG